MKLLDEKQMRQDRIAAVCEASEIIRLHQADEAITELEIAGKLGLTEYGVRWVLMDRGFEPRYERVSVSAPKPTKPRTQKPRDEYQAERRRLIAATYLSGYSTREVARQFGISKDRVLQILAFEGVARRPVGKVLPSKAVEASPA